MKGAWQFVADLISAFAPLAPAALGGLVTEYVGFLNISLEGLILAGGFSYIAVGSVLGPFAGVLAAMLVPALIAWLSDFFACKARADSFVIGLGVNLLVPGLASVISFWIFSTKGVVSVPALMSGRPFADLALSLPAFAEIFLGNRLSDYLALASVLGLSLMLGATPFGLRARATGINAESLRMAGIDPSSIRRAAYLFSGIACGISGAALASSVGAWVPNLSSGRGWIALVAVYLGGKKLGGTLLAVLLFAVLLGLANRAQSIHSLSSEIIMAIPYVITALVVIVGAFLRKQKKFR